MEEELMTMLKPLQEKLQDFEETKLTWTKIAEYIKSHAAKTEWRIKEEFRKLQQFLAECTLETLQHPATVSGAPVNVAKHLGNLKFRVWEKMQDLVEFSPVVLDATTASPCLILSEDLTSVRYTDEKQQIPDNPERFDEYACVLGSEGFDSGKHCWDVDVGNSTYWDLGVTTGSNQRTGDSFFNTGVWRVRLYDGKYRSKASGGSRTPLTLNNKLQKIRVELDWDRGRLSFSDPLNNTHIHTFTHSFTERMFPYLYNRCKLSPLRILPVKCDISVKQHS
ncbi:zinc-binding protein A33-like [Chanos chanos]|uniref:Zinc-binding protein A33-like n=1 Tax=Chanos chanos TaxID=29144 RepID=A0A6J2WBI2_CHACN|nr:zinc-binding protein A33-like [Chanos chanos]